LTSRSYSATISDLYQLQQFAEKQGVQNIRKLVNRLGNPQRKYPILHIAGTNGKGSTSIILQNILKQHGLKVGLYTSPHLLDFRERIRINDHFITKAYIQAYWSEMADFVNRHKMTFFDTTTALAFNYFYDQRVDVAIVETGLGGRLDSTNIVNPAGVILTPIHRDHTKQLGRRLKSIAREKAAIIKPDSVVFCGKQHFLIYELFEQYRKKASQWTYLSQAGHIRNIKMYNSYSEFDLIDKNRQIKYSDLRLSLAGKHQLDNAFLAYFAARWYLAEIETLFRAEIFKKSLKHISWPGRLQKISEKPDIYMDVSHNYDGFKKTLEFVKYFYPVHKAHLLVGLLSDKDHRTIARLVAQYFTSITVTELVHQKPLPAVDFAKELKKWNINPIVKTNNHQAFKEISKNLEEDDALFVMGSHFLVGNLLRSFQKST